MRHLTSHRVFLDGIRLWQASASLALNRAGCEIWGGLRCPCGGPQRQERFFFFRTWALSCELQHYLVHFFVYCTFLLFYRFYEFFLGSCHFDQTVYVDFYNFFQMLIAHFPSCDYPFVLCSYLWFCPPLFGLGSANLQCIGMD